MKTIFKKNSAFFLPYLLFLVIAGFFLVRYSKSDIHLYINQFHCPFGDILAPIATYFGSYFAFIIVASLLFYNYRTFIIAVSTLVISSIIEQTLKHTFFKDVLRPAAYFKNSHALYLVPNVKMDFYNSFPSGHTTTAFAVYLALALIVEKKVFKFLFFVLALSVAYSRVYLSQHFLVDVYFGSVIGVISTIFCYYFIENSKSLGKKNWINHSLIRKK